MATVVTKEILSVFGSYNDISLTTFQPPQWDSANVYSNGASEELIAKAIQKYNIPRQKLVIMTKICGTVREGNDPETLAIKDPNSLVDYINQRGLSRQGILNAVNASLKRLNTDYIDLLQIHRFDSSTPIAETMRALHDLVTSGKVRYIGASSMWTYQFAMMQFEAERNGWTKFVSMQNHYSLLYREEEREMNRYCQETGVGLIPVSLYPLISFTQDLQAVSEKKFVDANVAYSCNSGVR